MRGHGTYMKDDDDSAAAAGKGASSSSSSVLTASVAGVVQRVNKLISVTPLKTKYQCEIGDVVVGRITEVINNASLESNKKDVARPHQSSQDRISVPQVHLHGHDDT